jgi:hypothetical protein
MTLLLTDAADALAVAGIALLALAEAHNLRSRILPNAFASGL